MKRIAIALGILFLAACSSPNQFNGRLNKWHSLNIVNYSYDIKWSCFCTQEITSKVQIVVNNSKIRSRTYVDNNRAVGKDYYQFFPKIDGLFEILRRAKNNNAHEIDITWDMNYDFPKVVFIDYLKEAIDDERSYRISNFRILK